MTLTLSCCTEKHAACAGQQDVLRGLSTAGRSPIVNVAARP